MIYLQNISYLSCKGCKVRQSSSRGSTNCDLSLNLYTRNKLKKKKNTCIVTCVKQMGQKMVCSNSQKREIPQDNALLARAPKICYGTKT